MDVSRLTRRFDPDDWVLVAACRGKENLFFPPDDDQESRVERKAREAKAKSICGTCPVRAECLDEAMRSSERFGIWGGMTERERRSVVARARMAGPADAAPRPTRPLVIPETLLPGRPAEGD